MTINTERLLEGAALLEKVPTTRFRISRWIWAETDNPFDGTFECGFAGCAMGWFGQAKMWGLRLPNDNPNERFYDFVLNDNPKSGLTAAKEVFDISAETAEFLFLGGRYVSEDDDKANNERDLDDIVTPQRVAVRMRKLAELQDENSFINWCLEQNEKYSHGETL